MMLPVSSIIRGIWTVFMIFQSQIICIRGDCGPPPAIAHTQPVTTTSGLPGDNVTYLCDRSTGYYELPDKSRTITCQDDNTWSTVPDFCARACGVPESLVFAEPSDSDLKREIFLPGTTVSFYCKPGFLRALLTNNFITCLDNYTWSTPSEFCMRRSCGNPGDAEYGQYEAPDGFLFGSRVTYTCNDGYQMLSGSDYRDCQADGTWSNDVPLCEARSCGYPGDTNEGKFKTSHWFIFGSRATYTCNDGYRIVSKRDYRDCQADGTWSNDVPLCEAVTCPPPAIPAGGVYIPVKDEYTFLEDVTFYCHDGLHVIGAFFAYCTSDGTWSASSPTCKVVSCEDPGKVQNGKRISGFVGPYTLDSYVGYACEKGFVMNGSSTITCNVNNQWEPELPKCLIICPAPESPAGGRYSPVKDKYTHQEVVTFYCNEGLDVIGASSASCTSDGTWSAISPTCRAVSCEDPGKVKNGKRISMFVGPYTLHSIVTYECDKSFVMNGSSTITCTVNNRWEPELPECLKISCDHPGNINHGELQYENFLFGLRVKYTCNPGYKMLSATNYRECQANGTWSGRRPICKAPRCDLIWELQAEARECGLTPEEWIQYLQVEHLYLQIENTKLDIEMKKNQQKPRFHG